MEETREAVMVEEDNLNREDSQKEALKAARKLFSKLGWMYVIGTVVIYAVQLGAAGLVKVIRPEWLYNADISLLLSVLPMYLIGMPILILLVKGIPESVPARHGMKAGQFVLSVIMCFAIMFLSNLVGNIVTMVIGALKGSMVQNEILNITTSVSMWLTFVFMVICAPCMEEYVFRKLIVDRTIWYGQGVAMVVSGLMFGLFHGNLNQFVYAFSLGVFLAYLYAKTGNLKITIAIHMIINFMGGIVSSGALRLIDMDEYMRVMSGGADFAALYAYVMEHLAGWILYLLYMMFTFGVMIAGGVLMVVCLVKRKFVIDRGQFSIPRGKRFRTVILNVGMIVYCVIWIAMIIFQLFL